MCSREGEMVITGTDQGQLEEGTGDLVRLAVELTDMEPARRGAKVLSEARSTKADSF